MPKQSFTYSITRTIEIDVECVVDTYDGEVNILKATNCETGKDIDLECEEVSRIHSEGLEIYIQAVEDMEADNRYEEWKLERMG
tara:strand:- start:469 stop:720 length:252 start_codon:yes stop_codon:yes gene_type:complete